MRNTLLVVAICLTASVVFATAAQFQPLNVKTGLWRMTKTITWTDLPPQMAAMMKAAPQTTTYNSCVTTKDLSTNPWTNGSGDNCTWTALNSTSTDMEVKATGCEFGRNMTADVHGQIHVQDSENGAGSVTITLTGNGQTLHGIAKYAGRWVSASCPTQ